MNFTAWTTVRLTCIETQSIILADEEVVRQAVLCAGDTTLDHAAVIKDADGSERRSGFTGANSTHQCRDWEAIKIFLIENRSGNKTGILI